MSPIMPTYGRLDVAFTRGKGARLFTENGTAYIDGVSGIAVTNLGHCHPAVTAALAAQAGTLLHTSNLYRIPAQEQLAATLVAATKFDQVFFCNSGAEANETALKLTRLYGRQRGIAEPEVIVLDGAFHGRTMGALSATGNARIREPFMPMVPGFVRVPRNDLDAIDRLIHERGDQIVAVHVEPVQGEGGVQPMSEDYLNGLRARCNDRQWLLSFDEVQTGNGRCGALYAFQRLGVEPDILVTAKGLGNGMPIGACLVRGPATGVLGAGDHGTTFGGSPLACTVGQAVMDTLLEGRLWENADPIREQILAALTQTLRYPQAIREIRGLGLMIGIELALDCGQLVQRALDRQLLVNVTAGNTIRLLPPLVMTPEEAGILGAGLADVINELACEQEVAS